MKSVSYILLILVSAITFTPKNKRVEIPLITTKSNLKHVSDSLSRVYHIKIDSLDNMKHEVIELQKEIGVRK